MPKTNPKLKDAIEFATIKGFTPGPWRWSGDELETYDYDTILEARDMPEDTYPECQCAQLIMPNEEANKALIASAPDLLAENAELKKKLHGERLVTAEGFANLYESIDEHKADNARLREALEEIVKQAMYWGNWKLKNFASQALRGGEDPKPQGMNPYLTG